MASLFGKSQRVGACRNPMDREKAARSFEADCCRLIDADSPRPTCPNNGICRTMHLW